VIKGLTLRLPLPDVGAVARSLLGVLLAAAAGLHWGSAGAATAAAAAAAIAGATALQDSPRGRLPLVLAVTAQMGLAVLLGTATSAYSFVYVVVVTAWCFGAGLQWAVSANAGLVAAAAGALLVTAPPIEPTVSSVARATGLAVLGGLVQAVLVALWPRRRWRVQRAALARAYGSLARDARRLAVEPDAHVDVEPLIWLRDAFTLTEQQARRRPLAYRSWYGLPERISVTLTALAARASEPTVSEVLAAAGDVLDVVARSGNDGRRDALAAMARVDAAVDAAAKSHETLARRLSEQLRDAAALRFGEQRPGMKAADELVEPGRRDGWTSMMTITDLGHIHLTWSSPILRHAVRLGAVAGAGIAIARFADVPHGYWIPLTVLMVLRPETAHTYTRCAGRLAGNVVGIGVASVFTAMWHPTGLVAAGFAALFLAMAYVVSGIGYLALSAALAATIVFLIDISGSSDAATMGDRLVATLIGGALAVLAHVALPDHSRIRLRQRGGELLKTEIDYAATVIKAFVHRLDHPDDALAAAWERAFRARAAFEAAAGATRVEERDIRRWMKSYRAALNAVTTACTTLESSLPGEPPANRSGDFVSAVDEYVEVLCGEPPTPGAPWCIDAEHLAGAVARVRDAAVHLSADDAAGRVLVAELGTITRSVLGIPTFSPEPSEVQ
jgi:uncharacterized membrane protein YccC